MSEKTIILFVKYPEPGKVKTRLARQIGSEEKACDLYRQLAERNYRTLVSMKDEDFHVVVSYDPPESKEAVEKWLPGASRYFFQEGHGLGERIRHAFHFAFRNFCGPVIVMGSDTMSFDRKHASEAFESLKEADVVVGPAKDGGYYLIGMSQPHDSLFEDISWSTNKVMQETMEKIKTENLTYRILSQLEDLDEWQHAADERQHVTSILI